MNRVLGDYMETMLYKVFVSIDEETTVAEVNILHFMNFFWFEPPFFNFKCNSNYNEGSPQSESSSYKRKSQRNLIPSLIRKLFSLPWSSNSGESIVHFTL